MAVKLPTVEEANSSYMMNNPQYSYTIPITDPSTTASPVTTLNSNDGATSLDQSIDTHNKEMAKATPAPAETPKPAPTTGSVNDTLKSQGGLSLDEVNASGVDTSNYTYDSTTKYFLPKKAPTTDTSDATYQNDINTINSAFSAQSQMLDASTQNLISSIRGLYDQRIIEQKESNKRELAAFGTMNTRYGTSRYAPGVAEGVLTADERVGLDRLNKLSAEEVSAIATAQQNLSEKKYGIFKDNRDAIDKLRKDRTDTLTKLQETAAKKLEDDRNYSLKVSEFNEKAKNDKLTNDREILKLQQGQYEFKDLKDEFGNSIGTQVFDKATGRPISTYSQPGNPTPAPGSNGPLNPVGFDSKGSVSTGDQKKFLETLPPPIAALVTGLINYTAKPPANTKAGQKLNSLAHMADPTYDESQYNIRQKLTLDYTSGATGKNIISLNTSVNHLVDLSKNFAALPNSDITKFNTIKDWYDANVGKGNVTKVITDLNAVTGELAKVFKGTGATDEEIKNIKQGISLKSSPAQFKAFIEEATSLLGGRLDALNQTYENSVGKPFPRDFLTPDTRAKLENLKNMGYNIDVKGVKYSDPKSFVLSSPENKSLFQQAANEFPEYDAEEILQIIQD